MSCSWCGAPDGDRDEQTGRCHGCGRLPSLGSLLDREEAASAERDAAIRGRAQDAQLERVAAESIRRGAEAPGWPPPPSAGPIDGDAYRAFYLTDPNATASSEAPGDRQVVADGLAGRSPLEREAAASVRLDGETHTWPAPVQVDLHDGLVSAQALNERPAAAELRGGARPPVFGTPTVKQWCGRCGALVVTLARDPQPRACGFCGTVF